VAQLPMEVLPESQKEVAQLLMGALPESQGEVAQPLLEGLPEAKEALQLRRREKIWMPWRWRQA